MVDLIQVLNPILVAVEEISINFDPGSRMMLNVLLAFIMYGVALDLGWANIKHSFRNPRPLVIGLASQFLLLPLLTFILIFIWQPVPAIALGLFLVAACPGGTISNFFSSLAKADVGLSISLTAVSTFLCILMTPFNFSFWSQLNPVTSEIVRDVSLNPFQLLKTVTLILFIPVALGILSREYMPRITEKIKRPVRILSMLIFIGFVAVALFQNREAFENFWHMVLLIVITHNAIAFLSGSGFAKLFGLPVAQQRSISVETGIQNSGLGMVLSLGFFPEVGEMALVCATWGIWHIISGFVWSSILSRIES